MVMIWNGFNIKGIHKDTGTKYNKLGRTLDGYYNKLMDEKYQKWLGRFDENGFDKNGFDKNGIHKVTGTKYDEDGYDVDGYNTDNYRRNGLKKSRCRT